jgi:hypothetical protein
MTSAPQAGIATTMKEKSLTTNGRSQQAHPRSQIINTDSTTVPSTAEKR